MGKQQGGFFTPGHEIDPCLDSGLLAFAPTLTHTLNPRPNPPLHLTLIEICHRSFSPLGVLVHMKGYDWYDGVYWLERTDTW